MLLLSYYKEERCIYTVLIQNYKINKPYNITILLQYCTKFVLHKLYKIKKLKLKTSKIQTQIAKDVSKFQNKNINNILKY